MAATVSCALSATRIIDTRSARLAPRACCSGASPQAYPLVCKAGCPTWERVRPPIVVQGMSKQSLSAAAVLVVEDEPLVRDYVSDLLGQSGFEVVEASTGEEALLVLAEGGVCAIVSDVSMPGAVNGFELARRVREESPRTGVVLVSGVIEPDVHLPGGVRFLTKPVKASTLLRLLREVADPRVSLPEPTSDELP